MGQINDSTLRGELNIEAGSKITANDNRNNTVFVNTDNKNNYGNTSHNTVINGNKLILGQSSNVIYGTGNPPSGGVAGQIYFKII